MSLWQRLIESGKRLFDVEVEDEPLPADLECAPDPNDVGFTAAVVGLGAKMVVGAASSELDAVDVSEIQTR